MEKQGELGLELTNLRWLIDHHLAKEDERWQMVKDIGLISGDKVLDLGCGPGLWSMMMAEEVKPDGKIIGMDISPGLLTYAEKEAEKSHLGDIIEFKKADFYGIPYDKETFDVTFFGNCFAYVTDHKKIMDEMKRVTKKGGRIIGKDFDGANIIFHPADIELTSKVLDATVKGLKERPTDKFFNNYVGRKLHGIFIENGLEDVKTKTYAIQKVQPPSLSAEAKRYITGNALWYADGAAPFLAEEDILQWKSYFNPESDNYILDLDGFYFCMLEVMTSGKVP